MLRLLTLVSFLLFVNTLYLRQSHVFSPNTSIQLAQSIKDKLLESLNSFSNEDFRNKFKSDLNQPDDSKRQLKSIDVLSAKQLFTIMKIDDPNCDKNEDGQINGQQLRCLNIIWKYYVPN